MEGFPGDWHLEVVRMVGEGRHAASWIQMTYADGTVQPGVCFFDLDDGGRTTHIIDFWPEPYARSRTGASWPRRVCPLLCARTIAGPQVNEHDGGAAGRRECLAPNLRLQSLCWG